MAMLHTVNKSPFERNTFDSCLNARGMTDDQVIDGIKVVDYEGFVDLTAECENVQAWL